MLYALTVDLRRLIAAKEESASSIEDARALDSRLHDLIAQSCGNAFLAKEIGRLKFLFRALRDVVWVRAGNQHEYDRPVEESREHLAVVEALLADNAKEAVRAMARHLRAGERYWLRHMPKSALATNGEPQA
jgi:DNA-binding GntR family transcriptional regulator